MTRHKRVPALYVECGNCGERYMRGFVYRYEIICDCGNRVIVSPPDRHVPEPTGENNDTA